MKNQNNLICDQKLLKGTKVCIFYEDTKNQEKISNKEGKRQMQRCNYSLTWSTSSFLEKNSIKMKRFIKEKPEPQRLGINRVKV